MDEYIDGEAGRDRLVGVHDQCGGITTAGQIPRPAGEGVPGVRLRLQRDFIAIIVAGLIWTLRDGAVDRSGRQTVGLDGKAGIDRMFGRDVGKDVAGHSADTFAVDHDIIDLVAVLGCYRKGLICS